MLYHFHEMHRAVVEPWRIAAEMQKNLFRNPFNPLTHTHAGRAAAAAAEVFEHTVRTYEKPEWRLDVTEIDGEQVAVKPRLVLEEAFCDLLHFERNVVRDDPTLLIVAPMSGHYATLLRGTVEAMLPDHEVYVTDWRDARDVPLIMGSFDLDDYIDYVIRFLHFLGPNTHVLAVCQPSVPVLAAVSLLSQSNDKCVPRTMTLMGGPIDTRKNPTAPNKLATARPIEWFEHSVISRVPALYPGYMRRVYPGFLQLTGFMTMNLERHVGAHIKLFHHLIRGDGDSADAHRAFYDEYLAVMDLPAEYYLQTVQTVFQEHALPCGTMVWRDRPIDPKAITKCALMTVEGENDDISGIGQTKAAHELCASLPARMRVHYEQEGVGHYGVFNGRRWREQISPRIKSFIRKHG